MTVVVAGDVMADVVVTLPGPIAHGSDTEAAIVHRSGGGGANVAARLGRLGVDVALVGRVGDDVAGAAVRAALAADGVRGELQVDPRLATGTCIVLVEPGGERSMLPDAGANAALAAVALPAGTAWLHVAGYALLRPGSRPAALALIAAARAAGVPFSVDPSSAAPLAATDGFLGWVDGAALLLPNRDEARVLTGHADPSRAAVALTAVAREVVVTLGADGVLWTDGVRVEEAGAVAVAGAVDTTGAGDAFAAGFLAERLRGTGPVAALAAGSALAAQAVAARGAR